MKVLLAGASGAIGMPLIRRLHAAGHDVLALHRSPEGRARLAAAGTTPIRVDVLSTPALVRALQGQRADAVICEITALKKTPMSHKDMTATNILRTKGTANLIAAAHQLGARRFLTQSMVFGYGYGDWGGRVLTEADQFGPPGHGRFEEHLAAMRSNEEQVLRADGLDGIALRYGLVYGPGPASDTLIEGLRRRKLPIVRNSGVLPWVYVDDGAARPGGRDRRAAGLQHPGQNRTRLDAPGAHLPRRHQPPCPPLHPGSGISRAACRGSRGPGREGLGRGPDRPHAARLPLMRLAASADRY